MNPNTPERMTIIIITVASAISPSAADTMDAAIRMRMRKLLNWDMNNLIWDGFCSSISSLGPCRANRFSASDAVSPVMDVSSVANTDSMSES